jgi:hypothetical protein
VGAAVASKLGGSDVGTNVSTGPIVGTGVAPASVGTGVASTTGGELIGASVIPGAALGAAGITLGAPVGASSVGEVFGATWSAGRSAATAKAVPTTTAKTNATARRSGKLDSILMPIAFHAND